MNFGWLTSVLLGMLLAVPAWLAITFFKKVFGISGEVFVIWYSLGVGIGSYIFLRLFGPLNATLASAPTTLGIFLIGLSIGAVANMLVFRAVALAPNPGLALSINSVSVVVVFFSSAALAAFVPQYFDQVQINIRDFIAILLILGGIAIITLR